MDYYSCQEFRRRGTARLPLGYYYLDASHPRYQMPFHWHLENEIVLVREGRLELRVQDETVVAGPGDVVWIDSGSLHGGSADRAVYECVVYFEEAFLGDEADLLPGRLRLFHPRGGETAEIVRRLCDTLRASAPGTELEASGLLRQFYGAAVRQGAHTPSAGRKDALRRVQSIRGALRLISKEFSGPLPLSALARAAGMSPQHFCRTFHALTRRTPTEYLAAYRIDRACALLLGTRDSVTDIALQCGFGDTSYFIRVFRRHQGMTPRAFRMKGAKNGGRAE